MSSIAEALTARLRESTIALEAVHAAVLRRQAALLALIDRQHQRVDAESERRALASVAELRERVIAAVRRGDFRALTVREARSAARMLSVLTPSEMAALVRARPEQARTFVEEFFRSWDIVTALPTRTAYAELVVATRQNRPFMKVVGAGRLVTLEGPTQLAAATPRTNIGAVADWLRELGLPLRWSFTANVLARVVATRLQSAGLAQVWKELGDRIDVAATVLPALHRTGGRWFFATKPESKSGSTRARATVIASMLETVYRTNTSVPEALVAGLLDSEFGDPRVPPESRGWGAVRAITPKAYGRFLEELVRQDLTLFFDHAMNETSRRKFWLLYLTSIRRTVCVLSAQMYKALERQLAGAPGEVRAALGRVRRFAGTASVAAFCLYFDDIVVVEFSDSGNAAYIYRRSDFDMHIEPLLSSGQIRNERDLKQKALRIADIKHFAGWETKAHYELHRLGART